MLPPRIWKAIIKRLAVVERRERWESGELFRGSARSKGGRRLRGGGDACLRRWPRVRSYRYRTRRVRPGHTLISRQAPDWDRAQGLAREVDAERILRLGLRLASDVLGAQLPFHVSDEVSSDPTVAKLAAQISRRLGARESHTIGILQRAVFRIKMRGNLLQGASYLLRLSLSPTEEDWAPGKEGTRPTFLDSISRPIRLAKKHSRRSEK